MLGFGTGHTFGPSLWVVGSFVRRQFLRPFGFVSPVLTDVPRVTMTAADSCGSMGILVNSSVATFFFATNPQASLGKSHDLLRTLATSTRSPLRALGFVVSGQLARVSAPHMWFLFVKPRICLRLLSGVASRPLPLPLAWSFRSQDFQRIFTSMS